MRRRWLRRPEDPSPTSSSQSAAQSTPRGATLPSEVFGHGDWGEARAEPRILPAPGSQSCTRRTFLPLRAPHQTLSPRGRNQRWPPGERADTPPHVCPTVTHCLGGGHHYPCLDMTPAGPLSKAGSSEPLQARGAWGESCEATLKVSWLPERPQLSPASCSGLRVRIQLLENRRGTRQTVGLT